MLNGLGIWTYAQIAGWSREEIAWVDDYLRFKGRIGRDGWLEQAVKLAKKTKQAGKRPRTCIRIGRAMEIHETRDVLDVRDATVANSRFDDVNLSNSHFHNTNLSAAAFEKVLLSNARVVDANVSGALFSNVNMSNVKIEKAIFTGMTIAGIKVSDFMQASEAA